MTKIEVTSTGLSGVGHKSATSEFPHVPPPEARRLLSCAQPSPECVPPDSSTFFRCRTPAEQAFPVKEFALRLNCRVCNTAVARIRTLPRSVFVSKWTDAVFHIPKFVPKSTDAVFLTAYTVALASFTLTAAPLHTTQLVSRQSPLI
jgi:hypothetical protein